MADQAGPLGVARAGQHRQQAEAVFAPLLCPRLLRNLGERGIEVGQAGERCGCRAWGDAARPAGDHRHAVPTFEDVRLVAPVATTGIVVFLAEQLKVGLWRAAVVAGEDHQRVVVETGLFDGVEQVAH